MIRSTGFNFHCLLGEIDGNSKQQIRYSSINVNRGKCQSGGFTQASASRGASNDCRKSGNNSRSKSTGKNTRKSRSEKTSGSFDIKHNFAHNITRPNSFGSRKINSGKACCKSSGNPNNNGHFSDPQFDQLVDEADRLGDRTQIERRLQLYNQAEQIAIDQVAWAPLFYPKLNILLRPRVTGIVLTPQGLIIPDWSKVELK